MIESSSPPNTSNDDELSQLRQSLEESRKELSEAREKIARLEAENAELRRRSGQYAGNKNGQAHTTGSTDGEQQGVLHAEDTAADGAGRETKSDPDENEEKKDDESSGTNGTGADMSEPKEASPEEKDTNNAQTREDTDKPDDESVANDGGGESIEKSGDGESESDDGDDDEDDEADHQDEQQQQQQHEEPPTSPADDIRLRAARTLIWADSAIKRAEALKEQQAAAESTRGSVVSGETPRSASRMSLGDGSSASVGNKPPSTVRIAQSVDTDSRADSNEDDASFLSEEDDDESDSNRSGQCRRGPLARIGRFLEDKMDDVADRLVAMDTTSDNRSLHSGSLGGGASGGLPPRSPPGNYKYCNDAMKKKMGGDDDASTRTPTSVRSGGDGDGYGSSERKPKPMMNEAMMRLSSEKKKRASFGGRLFSG